MADEQVFGFPGIDYSAVRRGSEEYEMEDGSTFIWPRCEITGCQNGICAGMSKSLCYPHGIEFKAFTVDEFEADRKLRHS